MAAGTGSSLGSTRPRDWPGGWDQGGPAAGPLEGPHCTEVAEGVLQTTPQSVDNSLQAPWDLWTPSPSPVLDDTAGGTCPRP